MKYGMRVAHRDVATKFSGVSDIEGGQSPRFPIEFAGHRYNSTALL